MILPPAPIYPICFKANKSSCSTDDNYDVLEQLTAFARARERTMGELAHAWLLAEPLVSSVISGATKVDHLLANVTAADWELSDEEMAEIRIIIEDK